MVQFDSGQILIATDYFHGLVASDNLVKNGYLGVTILLGLTLILIACNLLVLLKVAREQQEMQYFDGGGGGGDFLLGDKKLLVTRRQFPVVLFLLIVNYLALATVMSLVVHKHVEYQNLSNSVAHLVALYTELHQAHMG